MELGLHSKVAIVTGASRGLGKAIAVELAREGCDLFLTARDQDLLTQTAREITNLGRKAKSLAADLRQASGAVAVVAGAIAEFGRVDILVNNAGATKRGDFLTLSEADYLDGFALKFHGCVQMTKAAWPHLIKSSGAVINMIGSGGRNASAEFTIGGPVNAALMNYTKAIAQRGQQDNVRVNAISPSLFETDRLLLRIKRTMAELNVSDAEARKILMQREGLVRFGKPEEIGRLACYLASEASSFMLGSIVDIDGGLGHSI